MSFVFGDGLRQEITDNLRRFEHREVQDSDLRHAAVALVVVRNPGADDACVLLTLRPRHLNRHSGQFALPGGRLDAGETPQQGALRELHEELGLELKPQDVLGRLDDYPTRSGFCITPVVMWAGEGAALRPAPDEVAEVFHIPLRELDNPEIPLLTPSEDGETQVLSAILPSLQHRIFAPTAALLYQFREVAGRGASTRVDCYDQPPFAWR